MPCVYEPRFLLCACLCVYARRWWRVVMVRKVGGNANAVRLWGIRQTKFPHERATLIKATGGLSDCTSSLHQTRTNFEGGELSLCLSLALISASSPFLFALHSSRPLLSRLPLFSYNLLQPLLIFPRATCIESLFGYVYYRYFVRALQRMPRASSVPGECK